MQSLRRNTSIINHNINVKVKVFKREMCIISRLIESYANGGLDFINSKVTENPAFFDDDDCFVKLSKEVEYS